MNTRALSTLVYVTAGGVNAMVGYLAFGVVGVFAAAVLFVLLGGAW